MIALVSNEHLAMDVSHDIELLLQSTTGGAQPGGSAIDVSVV